MRHIIATLCVLVIPYGQAMATEFLDLSQHQPYGGDEQQDGAGQAELDSDNLGLTLTGNRWRAIPVSYQVTENTILEFDFRSDVEGEAHTIALDINLNNRVRDVPMFHLAGPQISYGSRINNLDFNDYVSGTTQHYRIPVGLYQAGMIQYLALVSDDDRANPVGHSYFSNMRLYEGNDFIQLAPTVSYGIDQRVYDDGTETLTRNDLSNTLEGNIWKAVEINYTLTPHSILEFDYASTREGEFQAIGFDNNEYHDEQSNQWFVLNGTHPWGRPDFNNYQDGIKHYRIPVGEFLTGDKKYLTLINDDDANAIANSTFSNVRLYEDETVCNGNVSELQVIPVNAAFTVNCPFDLTGRDIALPAGVTLNYGEGGSISNGELIFSGGEIDGRLLNASMGIAEGNNKPSLISTKFDFLPTHWNIVEGIVDDAQAEINKENIQKAIDLSKALGASEFKIGALDAYFKVGGWNENQSNWDSSNNKPYDIRRADYSIYLPSDFHLAMTDETYLRAQPTYFPFNSLLRVFGESNVKITGGNLYGDRYEHDYAPIKDLGGTSRNTHEWGVLIFLAGAEDVIIDNVFATDATGDAILFNSVPGHRIDIHDPDAGLKENQPYNKNIIVSNSILTNSRRNNISIVDGANITVENCIISDAGLGESEKDRNGKIIVGSAGVAPRAGIDIEPFVGYMADNSGRKRYFEKVEDVWIQNNEFINNVNASVNDYTGENVTIQHNNADNIFVVTYGTGTKILNNTLYRDLAEDEEPTGRAIQLASNIFQAGDGIVELSRDFQVIGNTITNFNTGIEVAGGSGIVSDNTITGFGYRGIGIANRAQAKRVVRIGAANRTVSYGDTIPRIKNFEFKNNILETTKRDARPLQGVGAGDNLTFDGLYIKSRRFPISFIGYNNRSGEENFKTIITNSRFESTENRDSSGPYGLSIKNSVGLELRNNTFVNSSIKAQGSNVVDENNVIQEN